MTVYAMKPILALLLIAFSAAAQVPPLPPEPAPKGHKSMADAENDAVRLRAAKTRQAQAIMKKTETWIAYRPGQDATFRDAWVARNERGVMCIVNSESALLANARECGAQVEWQDAALKDQPAIRRVRDEVARQKANPVKPSPMTPHPSRPVLRSPKTVLESTVQPMKKAESAPHEGKHF